MRDLKFRVWASNDVYPNGKMYLPEENPDFILNVHGDLIHSISKGDFQTENCWARIGFNDISVMQFIGLEDKNGKEIYEGDILAYGRTYFEGELIHGGNFPLIVYYTENASFEVKHPTATKGIPDLRADMMWQYEIIGNIYENGYA